MTVYGSEICSGCREFKALMARRGLDVAFVEITRDVDSMRAFLQLRDREDVFAPVRAEGRIGIPAFVREDGAVTLDADEALAWLGEPPREAAPGGCASCG